MTQVDQFESVFRSAAKNLFLFEKPAFQSILLVSDLDEEAASAFEGNVRQFLSNVRSPPQKWSGLGGADFQTSQDLLAQIENHGPDLICTYRNLHSEAWHLPHSLGEHLDVLTQRTSVPVLVLPHPKSADSPSSRGSSPAQIMAITDHLVQDALLVNWAAQFTPESGTLFLAHIEDRATFDRFMQVIAKIPAIDTQTAEETLSHQLLKEPRDYLQACKKGFAKAGITIDVQIIATFGHFLADYQKMVENQGVDLLVMNTKDDDHLAMHGLVYPLVVTMRHIPILLL